MDLGAPLLDHAHRADDERRPERLVARVLPLRRQHRDRLHRLAEAHVVGEDRADAEVAEQPQPAVAALLEREERMRHRGRRGQRPEAALAGLEECGERFVERDLAELDPGLVGLEPGDRAHEIDDPGAGAAAVEEAERLLDVRPLDGMPAVADPDERLLGGGEVGELLVRQLGVADGEAPVEPSQLGRGEEAARAGARRARRRQVDADARRRAEPRRRQQDRHVALLELRHRLAEEEPHLLRSELRLRRLGHVEFDRRPRPAPAPARRGGGRGRGADRRRAGTRRRRRPRLQSSEAGRPRVGSSLACNQSSSTSRGSSPSARGGRSSRWRPIRHSVRVSVPSPPSTQSESLRSSAARPEWRGSTESAAVSPSSRWSIAFARPAFAGASRTRSARRQSRAIWSTRTG